MANHLEGSIFCSRCGSSLGDVYANSWRSKWPVVLGAAIVLVPALWFGGGYLAGSPPTKSVPGSSLGARTQGEPNSNPHQNISLENDPQLNSLREKVEKSPDSFDDLKNLGRALFNKLKEFPEMPQPLVLEAVDVFSIILNKEQRDPEATIWMGDISFEQRLFQQSVEYYRRYLSIEPKDLLVKAKLASALTFLKNFKESESLLREVLASDPKNFQAAAYLGVTLAELGDIKGALEAIDTAVNIAPSAEAKERIERFKATLLAPPKKSPSPEAAEGASARNANAGKIANSQTVSSASVSSASVSSSAVSSSSGPAAAVAAYLRENQVAGPKFVSTEQEGQKIVIFMRDFPMEAMPPFAREKFVGGIRGVANKNGGTQLKISVKDVSSGAILWEEN